MKNKFISLLGLMIILWIICRLLIVERVPYLLNSQVSCYMYIILIILTISQIILGLIMIKTLIKSKTGRITLILIKLKTIWITKPLESIGKEMIKKEPIERLIEHWSKILLHFGRKKENIYTMVIIFTIFPNY